MKTIFTMLALVFSMSTVQAQKAIDLDPVTVISPAVQVNSNIGELSVEVKEDYTNQFANNPIGFVKEHFDLKHLDLNDYQEVRVSFINKKGALNATYNSKGDIIRTTQRFKDIPLPPAVRNKVFGENAGWTMVRNSYTASGHSDRIDKEVYKIKLTQGNQTRRVKVVPASVSGGRVVSN